MPRKASKHTGNKTSPVQKRLNRKYARLKLTRLLNLNYPNGAYQLILTYAPDGYIPDGIHATPDIAVWLRATRGYVYNEFQYIRTIELKREKGKIIPIHRVIMDPACSKVEDLAAIWQYGPFYVERITPEQFPMWARRAITAKKPCLYWKCWVSSAGLKQP